MNALQAALLTAVALAATTAIHYEAMLVLAHRVHGDRNRLRRALPLAIIALVAAHVAEIAVYALVFWFSDRILHLGSLRSVGSMGLPSFFYFAAETYSSLGYGDIIPTASMRLIASVEPLNGLLLLSWSGAFLYATVHSIGAEIVAPRAAERDGHTDGSCDSPDADRWKSDMIALATPSADGVVVGRHHRTDKDGLER